MRRIRKKDIVAVILSVCILVAANPILQANMAFGDTIYEQEFADLDIIFPDSVMEIIIQMTGSAIGVSGVEHIESTEASMVPEETLEPEEDESMEADTEGDLGIEEGGGAEDADKVDGVEDSEEAEDNENSDEKPDAADSPEMTIDEKKDAIYKELQEKKIYTFSWNGATITLTYDNFVYLCKLVQREAVSEDLEGRIMVADLVFNRVSDRHFPNDVISVINEKNQFSPVKNGTIDKAVPKKITIDAVLYAIAGVDYSQGAVYFKMTNHYSKWFATRTPLFSHGSHTFYK